MSNRPLKMPLEGPRRFLALCFVLAGAWYLAWRAGTLNPTAPALSGGLYGLEVLGYLAGLLRLFTGSRQARRTAPTAQRRPVVDVIVQADEEPVEVVRRSLLAALALQGPHEVFLLDDGRRAERAQLATDLSCRYLQRPHGVARGAASLNQALAGCDGELVALFRAGHAPRRDFLAQTVGHFDDDDVAFVQAAQPLQDIESLRLGEAGAQAPAWAEPVLAAHTLQQGRDAWNAAMLNDGCAVVRRRALTEIGGFATGTGAEALHTSLRLHAQGWQSVYQAEARVFNVAAESNLTALDQSLRSGLGGLQVAWREGLLLRGGLTLPQRLHYLAAVLAPVDGWRQGLYLLAPALVVLAGALPLSASLGGFAQHFLPYAVLSLWLGDELGRGHRRLGAPLQSAVAQFAALLTALARRVTRSGQATDGTPHHNVRYAPALGALAGLNGLALALGVITQNPVQGLTTRGLLAVSVWAGLNAALALWVMRGVSRAPSVGRASHRFPVPLAAELICAEGERLTGTIDDLSESGLRFYGTLLPSMAIGQPVTGALQLPDGPLSFTGEVRHLGGETDTMHQPRSIGCSIQTAQQDQRRLETFLYSADLPWQVQGDADQRHTLLSLWLPGQVAGPQAEPMARRRWNAAQLRRHVTAPTLPALLAAPDAQQADDLLISYSPLPEGVPLILNVFRRIAVPSRGVRLQRLPAEAGHGADLYRYRVEACAMPTVPHQDLPLADRSLLLDTQPKWMPAPAAPRRQPDRVDEVDYA
jgi:cellulose synthase (UDP-forming)